MKYGIEHRMPILTFIRLAVKGHAAIALVLAALIVPGLLPAQDQSARMLTTVPPGLSVAPAMVVSQYLTKRRNLLRDVPVVVICDANGGPFLDADFVRHITSDLTGDRAEADSVIVRDIRTPEPISMSGCQSRN